jgi:hypothetical protein
MRYLKRFNESNGSKEEIKLILNSFGVPTDKIRINEGDVDISCDVRILRDLKEIPFKFGNIDGKLEIITKHIEDWSFMPDSARKYKIGIGSIKNKFWKRYYDVVLWEVEKYDWFSKSGCNTSKDKILSDYYIEMAAHNGLLNNYSEDQDNLIWEDAKGEFFEKSNLTLNNYPFFTNYEDVDFGEVIQKAKDNDYGSCQILVGIMLNDDGFYKKEFEKYHLGDIYNQIRSIGINKITKYNSKEIDKMCSLINMNLQKTPETIERDKNNDCYLFIARRGFREREDGSYEKFLDIENMFKVNIYDESTYQTISMMRLRTRFNSESSLYMIWLPKDFFHSENERIQPNDYQLELIDKYKEKI